MKLLNYVLNGIKLVEKKLNKLNAATSSTYLELSWEGNKGNEVEINSEKHLIFTSQKINYKMKVTKKLILSNDAKNQHVGRYNLKTRTRC